MKTSAYRISLMGSAWILTAACGDATQFAGNSAPGKADARAVTTTQTVFSGEDPGPSPQSTIEQPPLVASSTTTTSAHKGATKTLTPEEVDKLISLCKSATSKTLIQKVNFPETRDCKWSAEGNLGRRDRYLQAIGIQSATIELPKMAQLCGIEVASAATTLHYDDFLILTLNDTILLSSNQQIISGLKGSSAGSYEWDFARIRGIAVDFASPAYCVGSSACQVPVTDVTGQFQFSIDPARLQSIAEKIVGQQVFDFALIATGDNDDRDCYHTAFDLEFRLKYVDSSPAP